jgi:hypothetical protein
MHVFDPLEIQASLMPTVVMKPNLNLRDVVRWLDGPTTGLKPRTRNFCKRSIHKAARLLRKKLGDIPACVTLLEKFPQEDYCLSLCRTLKAMIAFRRNLSAAINGATGITSVRKKRLSRNDSWKRLLDALKKVADGPIQSLPFHEKKLIAISVLASFARQLDLEVNQVDGAGRDAILAMPMSSQQRKAVVEGLQSLTCLQRQPLKSVAQLLPETPVPKVEAQKPAFEMPSALREELECWMERATRGEWSETDEDFVDGRSPKQIKVAARKLLQTLSLCGHADIANMQTIAFAYDKSNIVACVKTWRA